VTGSRDDHRLAHTGNSVGQRRDLFERHESIMRANHDQGRRGNLAISFGGYAGNRVFLREQSLQCHVTGLARLGNETLHIGSREIRGVKVTRHVCLSDQSGLRLTALMNRALCNPLHLRDGHQLSGKCQLENGVLAARPTGAPPQGSNSGTR
jgi:hypothetical protein